MKRLLVLFLSLVLLAGSGAADPIDLSGMSFDELVTLRDQLNLAIWNSQEWQEVTVPAGVWKIGEDIPVGYWTIRALPGDYVSVVYCDKLNISGTDPAIGWDGWIGTLTGYEDGPTASLPHEVSLNMIEGMYFICRHTVIFTPYAGKPDLGFH